MSTPYDASVNIYHNLYAIARTHCNVQDLLNNLDEISRDKDAIIQLKESRDKESKHSSEIFMWGGQ